MDSATHARRVVLVTQPAARIPALDRVAAVDVLARADAFQRAIADELRPYVKRSGLSYRVIAERLGVGEVTVNRVFASGRAQRVSSLTNGQLLALCEIVGADFLDVVAAALQRVPE